MSGADLVDRGYRAVFGRGTAGIDNSHMVDEESGEVPPMTRRSREYERVSQACPRAVSPHVPNGRLKPLDDHEGSGEAGWAIRARSFPRS